MESSAVLEKLIPVFRDVLDNDTLVIQPDTVAAEVDGWDSLAHIRLVVAIEEAFNVRFTVGETTALRNVGELIELIQAKLSRG